MGDQSKDDQEKCAHCAGELPEEALLCAACGAAICDECSEVNCPELS